MFTFLAYAVYAFIKYEECHIPRFSDFSSEKIRQLFSFATWNLYAIGSTVVRTQGLSIVLNKFLGTIINASYGLALQVSGAATSIASSILNAMNPQLMKAEGRGDRVMMLQYTTKESKYSYLMLSCFLIPIVIEMPSLLTLWLKEYPPYTVEFCRMVIISTIFDQATIGLTSANQAKGNIRNYSLITGTIRLITIPSAWICLNLHLGILWFIGSYLFFEVICGLSRIPLIKYTAGLDVTNYCKEVFLRPLWPIVGNILVCLAIYHIIDATWRFMITEMVGILVAMVLTYFLSLDRSERSWVIHQIIHRKND
jgi:O-antigen/teichoic acid export membrane protein